MLTEMAGNRPIGDVVNVLNAMDPKQVAHSTYIGLAHFRIVCGCLCDRWV